MIAPRAQSCATCCCMRWVTLGTICFVTELRSVRVAVDGQEHWGHRDGDRIVLDDGRTVGEGEVTYLAPVAPSKIIAVHLTYRSRVDEYRANTPPAPSYFLKPPSALNGHRGEIRR